jgi:nitroreductase
VHVWLKAETGEVEYMGVSVKIVVLLSLFLLLGMMLPGVFFQPEASMQAWDTREGDYPSNSSSEERLTYLLNYAILAPSVFNSQPWMFNVTDDRILFFADKSRQLAVADADQREQYISLGCALENLVIAAEHFGYNCTVSYFPDEINGTERKNDLAAEVLLQPNARPPSASPLFQAITARSTNRITFEPRDLSRADLDALSSRSDKDVSVFMANDSATKKRFCDLVIRADKIQYSDANYKSELGHWLSQGVMGPTGMDAKMAQMAVVFLDMGPEQIEKDAGLINSTPCIGFISTANNDSLSSIKAGRALEHLWLTATSMGLSLHPMSQAIEVPETKTELEGLLPADFRMRQVQQTFRLGYANSTARHSNRRPLQEVLVQG